MVNTPCCIAKAVQYRGERAEVQARAIVWSRYLDRRIDQLGSVEQRARLNSGRQAFVDLLYLGISRRGDGPAIAADKHERGAEDCFMAIHAGAAGPELPPYRHVRHVWHSLLQRN